MCRNPRRTLSLIMKAPHQTPIIKLLQPSLTSSSSGRSNWGIGCRGAAELCDRNCGVFICWGGGGGGGGYSEGSRPPHSCGPPLLIPFVLLLPRRCNSHLSRSLMESIWPRCLLTKTCTFMKGDDAGSIVYCVSYDAAPRVKFVKPSIHVQKGF